VACLQHSEIVKQSDCTEELDNSAHYAPDIFGTSLLLPP